MNFLKYCKGNNLVCLLNFFGKWKELEDPQSNGSMKESSRETALET